MVAGLAGWSAASASRAAVAGASAQIARAAEESGRAVGEIAASVGDVAEGAERQQQMVGSAERAARRHRGRAARSSSARPTRRARPARHARPQTPAGRPPARPRRRWPAYASGRRTSAARWTSCGQRSQEVGGIVDEITAITSPDEPARAQRRDRGGARRRARPRLRGRGRRGTPAGRGVSQGRREHLGARERHAEARSARSGPPARAPAAPTGRRHRRAGGRDFLSIGGLGRAVAGDSRAIAGAIRR